MQFVPGLFRRRLQKLPVIILGAENGDAHGWPRCEDMSAFAPLTMHVSVGFRPAKPSPLAQAKANPLAKQEEPGATGNASGNCRPTVHP
jgi:hypothetical protein